MLDQRTPPPTDPVATSVAEIFAGLFERDSVGIDEDFFRLGGDSLIAAALTDEIANRFGVDLSISALIEAPTPTALAGVIAEADTQRFNRNIIPVRSTGRGPALFCIHGMDGESFFPQQLGAALGQDRPLYGFRALGLESPEELVVTVESMAQEYLGTVLRYQPEGPYLILGHCGVGTMIAWEMASRLLASGKKVAGCILLDPANLPEFAPFLHYSGMALELQRFPWAKRAAELGAWNDHNRQTTGEKRREIVKVAMTTSVKLYSPKPISCPVLLLYSKSREDALFNERGYQTLVKDLVVEGFEASHHELLKERVEEVSISLRSFLDKVAPLT